ncbi:MAG: hypothetical protein ACHRXM_37075 [Isosphaerales bacterium]
MAGTSGTIGMAGSSIVGETAQGGQLAVPLALHPSPGLMKKWC